jgi:hypothetical protein
MFAILYVTAATVVERHKEAAALLPSRFARKVHASTSSAA